MSYTKNTSFIIKPKLDYKKPDNIKKLSLKISNLYNKVEAKLNIKFIKK